MSTKATGQITAVFGAHRQGVASKTGKPYNFIELSDGFEAQLFDTDLQTEQTSHLEKGDDVTVSVEFDPFNKRSRVVEIS